ncbi:12800_t:CDS:2, partial [Cetraspora pellucida]
MVLQVDLVLKSHYIVTIVLACISWIILLGGTSAITSLYSNGGGPLAALWFHLIYELGVILGLFTVIADNSMKHYRFTFKAFVAGAILLAMINLFWLLVVGSEEDSYAVKMVNDSYSNLSNINFGPISQNIIPQFAPKTTSMHNSDVRSQQLNHGSPEDRTELSFVKGDHLDIASKEGKWWHARKADGTTGIAP